MLTEKEQKTALVKKEALCAALRKLDSVAVAYSGGVDSTFLLKTAQEVLGRNVLAITACSYSFPARERKEAENFCKSEDILHILFESKEWNRKAFRMNPPNRCYLCKQELMQHIKDIAKKHDIHHVVEGTNMDDTGDYRPGMQAISELGILSPLREAGLYKEEIRFLSREMQLPTWDKPSCACLASRFAYGESITKEKLQMVERAEQILLDLGFRQIRVRIHGKIARIEVPPEELQRIMQPEIRSVVVSKLQQYGFTYITLDLSGYRTGSMNEVLKK